MVSCLFCTHTQIYIFCMYMYILSSLLTKRHLKCFFKTQNFGRTNSRALAQLLFICIDQRMKSLKITDQLHSICLVDRRNTCQRILYLRHVILFRFLSQNIGWFVLQRKIGFQVSRSFSFTSGNDQCKLTVNTQLGNLFFFHGDIQPRHKLGSTYFFQRQFKIFDINQTNNQSQTKLLSNGFHSVINMMGS